MERDECVSSNIGPGTINGCPFSSLLLNTIQCNQAEKEIEGTQFGNKNKDFFVCRQHHFSVENLMVLLKPLLDRSKSNERRFYSGTSLFRNSGKRDLRIELGLILNQHGQVEIYSQGAWQGQWVEIYWGNIRVRRFLTKLISRKSGWIQARIRRYHIGINNLISYLELSDSKVEKIFP